MKRSFLLAATMLVMAPALMLKAQNNTIIPPKMPVDDKTGLITYSRVVESPGLSATQAYLKGLAWAMKYYKNPTDVIRERDTVNNSILCKARFKISNPPDKKGFATDAGLVMYTIKVQFKDGRYRYELTEINWKQTSHYPVERWMDTNSQVYRNEYAWYLQQTDTEVKEVIKSLERVMQEKDSAKSDDW